LVSLDFLRGISIFAMTAFHAFENIIITDDGGIDPYEMQSDPVIVLLASTVLIFGYWRPFFLLISASVHMYSMEKSIRKGKKRIEVLKKQLFLGFLIYMIGLLRESVFSSYGFLGVSYNNKSWTIGALKNVFVFETLNMIGISIILSSLVHFFLTRNNGVNKTKRNLIIYGILAAFFIIMRPIVKMQVDLYFGAEFSTVQTDVSSFGDGILRLFWVMLAGAPEPIFPFLGTCFVGCMIGIYIAQEKPSKDVVRYGYISGFLLVVAGCILLILSDEPFSFIFSILPPPLYLFHLGMQIIIMFFALSIVEFNPKIPVKFVTRTTFLRRWGILSLTVYFFQIIDIFIRELLYGITGMPFNELNKVRAEWAFLMVIIAILFWEIILRVWEKMKYKGSLEFLISKVGALFGKKPDAADPLSVRGILYEELEPISYTDPNINNFKLPSG
jgi:hypothetical protein